MRHTALYETLGVLPTASPTEIRRAYRKLAQRLHPDREGGDAEAFTRVQTAYDVLGDPDRREKYDTTGDTSQPDHNSEMLQELAQLFFAVVENCADPSRVDIVQEVRRHLEHGTSMVAAERGQFEAKARKMEGAQKRLKHKGVGRDILADMLGATLADIRRGIEACAVKDKKLAEMRVILEAYTYRVDPGGAPSMQDPFASLYAQLQGAQWGKR